MSTAQRIRDKQAQLTKEIESMEAELISLRGKQAMLLEILGEAPASTVAPASTPVPAPPSPGPTRPAPERSPSREAARRGKTRKPRYTGDRPIREEILAILARSAEPLPSREIARALREMNISVAPNTIHGSINRLKSEGRIMAHARPGRGQAYGVTPNA